MFVFTGNIFRLAHELNVFDIESGNDTFEYVLQVWPEVYILNKRALVRNLFSLKHECG